MTIFKEVVDQEYLTTAEAKEVLSGIEAERALDEDREMRYELARAIEHVNRFTVLDPEESVELVEERLAACVNRVACDSVYRWEGEVVTDDEVVLLAKTTDDRYG